MACIPVKAATIGSYAASLLNDLSAYRSPCALRTHLGLEGAWLLSSASEGGDGGDVAPAHQGRGED
jgi:hypothetical protein